MGFARCNNNGKLLRDTVLTGNTSFDMSVSYSPTGYTPTWSKPIAAEQGTLAPSGDDATLSGLTNDGATKVLVILNDDSNVCPDKELEGWVEKVSKTTAYAGKDSTMCISNLPFTRAGNGLIPGIETGSWITVSGPQTYTSGTQDLTVPSNAPAGTYVFKYEVVNTVNPPSTKDDFTLVIEEEPSASTVETGKTSHTYQTCDVAQTVVGDAPLEGTGTWTVISGPGKIKLGEENNPTATIENLGLNTITVLEWIVSNGTCGSSTAATVRIEQKGAVTSPVISVDGVVITNNGDSIEVCVNQTVKIEGAAPNTVNGETAQWSGTTGLTSSNEVESITFSTAGKVDAVWTINSTVVGCSQQARTVNFKVQDVPAQPSITGATTGVCENTTGSYSVAAVTGVTYSWSTSSQALVATGQGSANVDVDFIQQSALNDAQKETVWIYATATNTCGDSETDSIEVIVDLAPRSADYLNSIVEIQGGGNSICETTTGEVLETTPTGTNHTEYRWSFGGLDLGTTTSATLNVSKSEMPAFTDAASTIIVEYGNACGYYGAEADTTIDLLSEKPFEVALSLDNESPLDSVLTRDLYAICGLESAYDIKVEGGSGVNLTGVDVEYNFTIVGNPTGAIPSNQSDGSLLLPGIENLTDGDIIVNASLTDPSQGCFTTSTASDQISLRDYTFEAFTIVGDNLICESDNDLSLSVSSGQATADDKHYKIEEAIWTLGDGSVLTGTTITLGSPSQQGDISVELTNIKGCQEFYSKAENGPFEVTIDEKPVIIVEGKPVITVPVDVNNDLPEYQLNGYVTNLQPTDYVASWNAESLTSKLTESEILAWLNDQSIVNPIIDPLDEEVARLVVTVVNGACESKDSIDVRATKPFLPPTAFTPNGDGLNDSWVVEGLTAYNKAVMKVYNRWGQLVFEKYGGYYDQFAGKNLPMATYYWTVEFNEPDKAPESGTVTILK